MAATPSPLLGLHHVTATVDDAKTDLTFSVSTLGLRLVKKTVNFDNPHVYHFYYGDERGSPGTIWTTFPYKDHGVRRGTAGSGQVTATSFSVPAAALEFWRTHLASQGVPTTDAVRFGEAVLTFHDPSGLLFEIIGTDRDHRRPWTTAGIDASKAVCGVHSVTLRIQSPPATLAFMTGILGFEIVDREDGRTRLALAGDAPGRTVDVVLAPDDPPGRNGTGTVHHVAFGVATSDDQIRMRHELIDRGHQVTEVLDRQYFQSIYFREPGGVLFEIATLAPGFLVDEALSELGTHLKLPPWEESNRRAIEAGLADLS